MTPATNEDGGRKRYTPAVTTSTVGAAAAGAAILRAGGNAFDAAVATALACCVADPGNTGIGGYGGCMVARRADGTTHCVDFSTWAPSCLPTESLRRRYPASGPEVSSIPNNLAGLSRVLSDFGTMSWAAVSGPAIELARDGVVAAGSTIRVFADSWDQPFLADCFEIDQGETADGTPTLTFRQPKLARTLETLAEKGPQWFYRGPIAAAACDTFRRAGIDMTPEDWEAAPDTVTSGAPTTLALGDVRVHSSPLDVTGAACVFGIFAAAERVAKEEGLDTPDGLSRLAQRIAGVWQYRFARPGGNSGIEDDLAAWIEGALDHTPGREPLIKAVSPEAVGHTTHLNTMDGDGTLVALTFTHGFLWFGGLWAIPETGVLMNSGMLSFVWTDPVRRQGRNFGVCNIAPTVAEDAARNSLAIGSPGGRRIGSRVGMALARHFLTGRSLQDAISSGRIHTEDATKVTCESRRLGAAVVDALRSVFPEVTEENIPGYNSPQTGIRLAADGQVAIGLDDRETPGRGELIG
jgi:gamma-glutamyltranspeptidase/glutathione hydrolase